MIAEEMRERHEKLKTIMSEIDIVADEIGDDQLLVTGIKTAMERIFQCEKSAIFLREDKFLVSNSQDYGRPLDMENELLLKDVKIPLGVGLTGLVGTMGQVMFSNNPGKEEMYCNVPAFQSRYRS
uniref:GAF domain-containing protein n=1 Tax=Lygus hesperus TaxID=30085 RepID=A0A0K8T7V7_LYGHE